MPIFGETGIAVSRTGTRQYTITISGESTKAFKLFSGFPTLGSGDNLVEFTKSQTGLPDQKIYGAQLEAILKAESLHQGDYG